MTSDPSSKPEKLDLLPAMFLDYSLQDGYMPIGFQDAQDSKREGKTLQMYPLTFFF